MPEISDMDWAQHIKMDYAQNLRKDSEMAKKRPSQNYTGCVSPFHSSTIPGICTNFIKFGQNCQILITICHLGY